MRLLLNTHAFLWFVLGDSQLSARAKASIEDPANEKLVSPASMWEIAIKVSLGKYAIAQPFEQFFQKGIDDNGFVILPVEVRHAAVLAILPFHHRDPFDRLLISQAIVEQVSIVSIDSQFDAYGVPRIW